MATQEDHVLQSIHADRTVHLLANLLQLLLQTSESHRIAHAVRCRCRRGHGRRFRLARRTLLTFAAQLSKGHHRFDHGSASEAFLHQMSTFYRRENTAASIHVFPPYLHRQSDVRTACTSPMPFAPSTFCTVQSERATVRETITIIIVVLPEFVFGRSPCTASTSSRDWHTNGR